MIAAGLIWGLFNVGFAMIFSFGPSMLVERGWSIAAAGSTISIVLWICGDLRSRSAAFSPIASERPQMRSGRRLHRVRGADDGAAAQRRGDLDRDRAWADQRPAGRADHEPARARAAAGDPAIGMGMFYTLYYAAMMLGPVDRRRLRQMGRQRGAAFDFGAAMILACPVLLWGSIGLPPAAAKLACPHFMQPPLTAH